jgi:broad specificity polyphosphatase/5'/3'-nucleotidase SurE
LDKTKKAYRIPILITNDDNKRKGYGSEVIDILTDFIDETEESFVILVPYIPTSRQDYQAFYNKNGFTQSEGETQTTLTFHKRYVKIS